VENLFEKINISDARNFQKVTQYRINMRKQLLETYHRKNDIKRAEEYWKNKEYFKAQELYEKHVNSLSNVQICDL